MTSKDDIKGFGYSFVLVKSAWLPQVQLTIRGHINNNQRVNNKFWRHLVAGRRKRSGAVRRLSSLEATESTASRCAPGMLEAAPSLCNISSFSLFITVTSSLLVSLEIVLMERILLWFKKSKISTWGWEATYMVIYRYHIKCLAFKGQPDKNTLGIRIRTTVK